MLLRRGDRNYALFIIKDSEKFMMQRTEKFKCIIELNGAKLETESNGEQYNSMGLIADSKTKRVNRLGSKWKS